MIKEINKLKEEATSLRAEVQFAETQLREYEDKAIEHKQKHLEYEDRKRKASYQLRAKRDLFNNTSMRLRTYEVAKKNADLDAKLEELKEAQPTFWEVVATCLDEVVEATKEGIDLTFKPQLQTSTMLQQLKLMTDLRSHLQNGSGEVLEAQKEFDKAMTDICIDQIEGNPFIRSKQKLLKEPIYKMLNNQTIKSALGIS